MLRDRAVHDTSVPEAITCEFQDAPHDWRSGQFAARRAAAVSVRLEELRWVGNNTHAGLYKCVFNDVLVYITLKEQINKTSL